MTDLQTWNQAALAELSALRNDDGGWGYASGAASNTEATALCMLALSGGSAQTVQTVQAADESTTTPGLAFLSQRQFADGSLALSGLVPEPTWATSLAGMALARAGSVESADAVAAWLLAAPAFSLVPTPATYGYNTGLIGWPWTSGDYSFVEPTSAAMVFLKQQAHTAHPRVREAVTLLLDRSLPDGGWNYGESIVLGSTLLAAAVPTAMALVALADEPSDATAAGLDWLLAQRGSITSLFSLGWAGIALNPWGVLDAGWESDIITLWNACPPQRRTAMNTALCMLAMSPSEGHPFAI